MNSRFAYRVNTMLITNIYMRSQARRNIQHTLRNHTLYPFLILSTLLPFSFYMHRSKIPARGIELHSFSEYLAYYHADILPLAVLSLLLAGIRSARRLTLPILAPFYYLAVFDWTSWHTQGNTFFFSDVYRAIQLIIFYPEFLEQISPIFTVKAIVLFLLPFLIFTLLLLRPIQERCLFLLTYWRPWIVGITALYFGATIFLFNRQYANYNAIAFLALEQYRSVRLQSLAVDSQLMSEKFGHHLISLPSINTQSNTTKSGLRNVILFVIETAPEPFFPSIESLLTETNNSWLQKNAVIFTNHHSTHAESDRSNYSIISGKYPPMWKTRKWKSNMRYTDSLPKILKANHYENYLLVTAPLAFNNDYDMYRNLGFEFMEDIPSVKDLIIETEHGKTMDRTGLYPADRKLIARAKEVISQHKREKTSPFFMNIAPQSSHAPFHCPPDEIDQAQACATDQKKIAANAKWQFGLIKEIIDTLASHNLLSKTIIIVTGDHGIRSKQETSLFDNANLLQSSTFKVPLLIASEELNEMRRTQNHPTSHIDIAPSLLTLLDLKKKNYDFHGVNLFYPTERTIYLIGDGYLPVNGFMKNGMYFMENRSNGAIYASDRLDFTQENRQDLNRHSQRQVSGEILTLEAFLNQIYKNTTQNKIQ